MTRLEQIPADTLITPGARTLRLEPPDARYAVLVLHGYTGFIGDMRYLAEQLRDAGFAVLAPRLPGHGTNNRDFRATNGADWLRAAVDGYLDLAGRYDQVMVAGLSMGAVLSVLLSARFPLARAALLAPALDFTNRLVPFTPWIRFLVPPYKPAKDPAQPDSEPEDAEREFLTREYWDWAWPRETAELYRLARYARRVLPDVTCPTLTVVSESDRTVPVAVADRIRRNLGTRNQETLILKESGHVVCNDIEKETVARAVIDWFNR